MEIDQPLRGGDMIKTPDGRQGMIVKIQRSEKIDSLEYNIKFADNTYAWFLRNEVLALINHSELN